MDKYLVGRNLPGAENLSEMELIELARQMVEGEMQMQNGYKWIESFVTEDKVYCVVYAESVAAIRAHARASGLPVNIISKVKTIITEKNSRKPNEL
jgi:hypothetical protein